MRILHIDTGREMRGGQWQVLQLLRGLAKRGIESKLLARGPLLEAAHSEHLAAGQLPSLPGLLTAASGFDLIHAHDARAHTLALICRKPLVVSRRVAFVIRQGFASAWKYRQPRRFLAISQAVKRQLLEAGVPEEKIDVVYDGVLIPERVIPYEEREIPRLAIQTSDPMKGSDLIAASGLELQFSSNLADDLVRTKVLVYLSRNEGLGSAALLASAFAVPVVASRVGGLVEAVEHEVSGLLVENDPAAIAAAVHRLEANPEWAAQLGRQGRERVQAWFDGERSVDATIVSYRRVV
jgi:hypothetical protein